MKNQKVTIEVVYSPDDGGYYAEVWTENGHEIHVTVTTHDRGDCLAFATCWLIENGHSLEHILTRNANP